MKLSIIFSFLGLTTLITAGPTPVLSARDPTTTPFTLWGSPAEQSNPMQPQRIGTYQISPGNLGLAMFGTGSVTFIAEGAPSGSGRNVYTVQNKKQQLVLTRNSPSDIRKIYDAQLAPAGVKPDQLNIVGFSFVLQARSNIYLRPTNVQGQWYRCVRPDGVHTIHFANSAPQCPQVLMIELQVRDEA